MRNRLDRLAVALALALVSLANATSTQAVAQPRHPSASCAAPQGRCRVAVPRVGTPPLSDPAVARLVHRSPSEPRPDNAAANQHVPSTADLDYFRAHSDMPYKHQVTGAFTGTTDEIIQWAAYKHGLDPNLMRAVAAVESWWHMSMNGDSGDSFGLFQIRRPYHCCDFLAANDTAFNADYYGAIIRSYYDGHQTWLNTVSGNGASYRAGDLWGSVGAWFSGRWRDPGAERYVAKVKQYLRERVWRHPGF
jgi:hypothetical protein